MFQQMQCGLVKKPNMLIIFSFKMDVPIISINFNVVKKNLI